MLNCVDVSHNTKTSLLPKELERKGCRPLRVCAPRAGARVRHAHLRALWTRGAPCRNSPASPRCFICGLQIETETVSTILTKQREISSGWKDRTVQPRGLIRDGSRKFSGARPGPPGISPSGASCKARPQPPGCFHQVPYVLNFSNLRSQAARLDNLEAGGGAAGKERPHKTDGRT